MTLENDPDGDQEAYLTDRAIADADDLRSRAYKAFVLFGAKQETADNYAKVVLPKHIDNLERQFVNAGGDFWGGSSTLSLADTTLYDAIQFFGLRLIDGAEGIENPCGPALKAWIQRVESNERIKAYLESDQFKKLSFKASKSALGYLNRSAASTIEGTADDSPKDVYKKRNFKSKPVVGIISSLMIDQPIIRHRYLYPILYPYRGYSESLALRQNRSFELFQFDEG